MSEVLVCCTMNVTRNRAQAQAFPLRGTWWSEPGNKLLSPAFQLCPELPVALKHTHRHRKGSCSQSPGRWDDLMGRKAQDELLVRVGREHALFWNDGEGRLPVRVALDAVWAGRLSRHQGLQVGLHDLPVEGQLHVPVGVTAQWLGWLGCVSSPEALPPWSAQSILDRK